MAVHVLRGWDDGADVSSRPMAPVPGAHRL